LGVIAALVVGLFLYFLPTIVANQRCHRERVAIFVLNLLAGWTFAGWVAALVWSLTSNVEPPVSLDEPEQSSSPAPSDRDPLFPQAAAICIQHHQGTTALLQRNLSIGYIRASRLIDELEFAGILGPANGAQPRDVLVTLQPRNDQRSTTAQTSPRSTGSADEFAPSIPLERAFDDLGEIDPASKPPKANSQAIQDLLAAIKQALSGEKPSADESEHLDPAERETRRQQDEIRRLAELRRRQRGEMN
jgi:hypothetical protein